MPWQANEKDAIVRALAVTCEVTGTVYSEPARNLILDELGRHDAGSVLNALRSCARECKGKLSLGEIVERLERVDRKALSDARHERSAYLTSLRGCALVESIAWNPQDVEGVRRQLEAKGYKFAPPSEKQKEVRSLPHWQDDTEREP